MGLELLVPGLELPVPGLNSGEGLLQFHEIVVSLQEFEPIREWHGLPVDFHGFFSNQHVEENSLKILQFFLCKSVKK